MKTKTYRLTLNVELDPQGETSNHLKRQLQRVVSNAVNQGLLTGNTAATVEKYDYTIAEVKSKVKPERRKRGEHRFADCGGVPCCVTCGCDEDDAFIGGQECSYQQK